MKEAGENFRFSKTHPEPFIGRERWVNELEGLDQTAKFLESQLTSVNDRRDYVRSVLTNLDKIIDSPIITTPVRKNNGTGQL